MMRFLTDVAEALQMRDITASDGTNWSAQWIPWSNFIQEDGLGFYVWLLWEFQSAVEKRMAEVPNEKGVRAFSLFSVSTTYTRAHIKLNATTLYGFYAHIKKRVDGFNWNLPSVSLSLKSFQDNRWTVIHHTFDISQFETTRQ